MTALTWQTPTRYYRIKIQKDLFGDLAVLCIWGSRNSKHGNYKLIRCSDVSEVKATIREASKLRKRHGYKFVSRSTVTETEADPSHTTS